MTRRLTELVHERLATIVRLGDTVVDATSGNGHDTLALAKLVGQAGRVYAFDIQESALTATAARLADVGLQNVVLIHDSHANLANHVAAPISAVIFNLGYLPGGDHSLTTHADSTVRALAIACELLKPNGIVSILAYVGHPGGIEEAEAVDQFCGRLDPDRFSVDRPFPACDLQPRLTWIHRKAHP